MVSTLFGCHPLIIVRCANPYWSGLGWASADCPVLYGYGRCGVVCVCGEGLGYTNARDATTLQSCETGGQEAASDRQLLLSWLGRSKAEEERQGREAQWPD